MNGNLLVLFFLLRVRLARNGAKVNGVSRSVVQRQPKRASMRCWLLGQTPKWLPNQSGGPTPLSTTNASSKKQKPRLQAMRET